MGEFRYEIGGSFFGFRNSKGTGLRGEKASTKPLDFPNGGKFGNILLRYYIN